MKSDSAPKKSDNGDNGDEGAPPAAALVIDNTKPATEVPAPSVKRPKPEPPPAPATAPKDKSGRWTFFHEDNFD